MAAGPRTRVTVPALAALYAAAAVVATAPAVGRFGSAYIAAGRAGYGEAAQGDHLQTGYWLWLVGHQLGAGRAPWTDPFSFQPLVPPRTVLGGWPFGLPFWPLDALFGPVVAWNTLLLATIVAAGLVTYGWLRTLAVPPAAAALGGLAFAIAPYRVVQSGEHLLGWIALCLPLALWAFERARTSRPHAWGALAAVAIASVPLSGQLHLALGAVPLAVAYAAVRFRPVPTAWLGAGALAAIAVGLVVRATIIEGSAAAGGRSLAEVAYYSASPLDLVSRWQLANLERWVYLGWLTPLLALAGVVLLWRRGRGLALLLGLAVLVPVLLALGTRLPLYAELRDVFPPLRFPRVPGRLLPVANLALAALAAFAAAALIARARRPAAVAALLVALVAADLLILPLRASAADPDNEAYAALAAAPPGRILELPVLPRGLGHVGSVYLDYAHQAPRERPTGYSTLAPPETVAFASRFAALDCGVWRPGDAEKLEALGVRFLLFHAGVYAQAGLEGAWFAWRALEERGWRPVANGGRVWLLERRSGPAAAAPVAEPDRSRPVACAAGAGVWTWSAGRWTLG
jgi:hypothetical protein